nr:MAG TPA: hypothetical protein [Caudoviricetes sp.]
MGIIITSYCSSYVTPIIRTYDHLYSSSIVPHSRHSRPVIHRRQGYPQTYPQLSMTLRGIKHSSNDKKRKETKTIERRIIAVYYSTKRLIIVVVSLLLILFTGVTGTPHKL